MSNEIQDSRSQQSLVAQVRARTPARILVPRAGVSYDVSTHLELRADHAAALDAVRTELDFARDFSPEFVAERRLFEVQSQAGSKHEFLLRPDLGRKLSEEARELILEHCYTSRDVQLVVGDGLSAQAVRTQIPLLLPALETLTSQQGWSLGQTFAVRYCRVGIMNEIGELLSPRVVVLLIGERPGLATSESLSAYLAYQPRPGHTDAQRNLISNIHTRGIPPLVAAERIALAIGQLLHTQASGVGIDIRSAAPLPLPPPSG